MDDVLVVDLTLPSSSSTAAAADLLSSDGAPTNDSSMLDSVPSCAFQATAENHIITAVIVAIFALSVVGNSLVIAVMVQQRHMRSVTNTYLLNLAVSDLMLSVICMPPTLYSTVTGCWIGGGNFSCKLFAYLQPTVVTASAYTLAVIAFERYFAICKPLSSRIWQTRKHSYCMIMLVWGIALTANLPYTFLYGLTEIENGAHICSSTQGALQMFYYQVYITLVLLIVPSLVMTILYGRVISTLKFGIRMDIAAVEVFTRENSLGMLDTECSTSRTITSNRLNTKVPSARQSIVSTSAGAPNSLRSTHTAKSAIAKQRVVRMLLVIVVIFFCCWTPSYTFFLFIMAGDAFADYLPNFWNQNIFHFTLVLTYLSSCTNPITYCFMNQKFRSAMLNMFGHKRAIRNHFQKVYSPGVNGERHDIPKLNLLNSRTSITDPVSIDLNDLQGTTQRCIRV